MTTHGNQVHLDGDSLSLGPGLRISFQRTLRIPDDGRTYPLPPGLGRFPVRTVARYRERVPEPWRERAGVFIPMYQREAMWLLFDSGDLLPRAIKVGVGKVCALTGNAWSAGLHARPQDYLVTPPQPWLDGIATGQGRIRQFVAMPLGLGYTVEGQVTGAETEGGLQLQVFEPKPGRFPPRRPAPRDGVVLGCAAPMAPSAAMRHKSAAGSMGLGAGGRMKQKLYPDPHGIEAWDSGASARCFVHIANSELWQDITGEAPPPTPVTAKRYAEAGLPWFDLYDEHAGTLGGSDTLQSVKSIKELDQDKSSHPQQDDTTVEPGHVHKLPLGAHSVVEDGEW